MANTKELNNLIRELQRPAGELANDDYDEVVSIVRRAYRLGKKEAKENTMKGKDVVELAKIFAENTGDY